MMSVNKQWLNLREFNEALEAAGEQVSPIELIRNGKVAAEKVTSQRVNGKAARDYVRQFGFDVSDWPKGDYTVKQFERLTGIKPDDLPIIEENHYAVLRDSLTAYLNRDIQLSLADVRRRMRWTKRELFRQFANGAVRVYRRADGVGVVREESMFVFEHELDQWPLDCARSNFSQWQQIISIHLPKNYNAAVTDPLASSLLKVVRAPTSERIARARDSLGQLYDNLSPFYMRPHEYVTARANNLRHIYLVDDFARHMATLDEKTARNMLHAAEVEVEENASKRDILELIAARLGVDLRRYLRSYTVDDAAAILDVSTKTIYRRIDAGELDAEKDGKSWQITRHSLRRLKGEPLFTDAV